MVDILVRSNTGMKGCFSSYKSANGSYPSESVRVRFTLKSSGKAKAGMVLNERYKDTDLDICLSYRVTSIKFPSFDGSDATYTVSIHM